MNFRIHTQRNESSLGAAQPIFLALDDGITHAVAAGIFIQLCFGGLPAGVPHEISIFDVEIAAAIIYRHIVVAIAGNSPQTGIPIEAIATGRIAHQAKHIFAAQVVDPRVGCPWRVDDVFSVLIVKVAVLHDAKPPVCCAAFFCSIPHAVDLRKRFRKFRISLFDAPFSPVLSVFAHIGFDITPFFPYNRIQQTRQLDDFIPEPKAMGGIVFA